MRLVFLFLTLCSIALGAWWGMAPALTGKKKVVIAAQPEKDFPLREQKPFVFVLYARNHADWCERSLRSLFSQEYEQYRLVVIDDLSSDSTFEKMRDLILASQQDARVILIRNEKRMGIVGSLYRAMEHCKDAEIVVALEAKDWLAHPGVLSYLNDLYQNPDVWMVRAGQIDYPSYEKKGGELRNVFYAGIFKQIRLPDLFQKGGFVQSQEAYLRPLAALTSERVRSTARPLFFINQACPTKTIPFEEETSHYEPLAQLPSSSGPDSKTDVVIFSYNRPLQLYACLESFERYATGLGKVSVLYRAEQPAFAIGYEKVAKAFPDVCFVRQSDKPKKDFKPHVLDLVFGSPHRHIAFAVDDLMLKDFVAFDTCASWLDRTGAYGIYLRLGKNITYSYQAGRQQPVPPSVPLGSGVFAWELSLGKADWGFPNTLDLTVYSKEKIHDAFEKMKFDTPNGLEFVWAKDHWPKRAIGLYFEQSKVVNVPLNIVSKTGNPHMNAFSPEELLVKFSEGLKIDLEPFYQVENTSPHFDHVPRFVTR